MTYDSSVSMQSAPDSRLKEYAARILFDGGISEDYVDSESEGKDKLDFMTGISKDSFATPLFGTDRQIEIYRFDESMEPVSTSKMTRERFVSAKWHRPPDPKKSRKTDIASVVEYACRLSENNWDDGGRTFWILVSDDIPNSTHQKDEQAKRLRSLDLIYEWEPLLRIEVGGYKNPPLVEVREVYNRGYRDYGILIEKLARADEEGLEEILKELDELKADVLSMLKDLPPDLAELIAEKILKLELRAAREVYRLKLGMFALEHPGIANMASRTFIAGKAIRFSWTRPPCDGVSKFMLQIRNLGSGIMSEYSSEPDATELTVAAVEPGDYECTVIAFGRFGLPQFLVPVCYESTSQLLCLS